MGTTTRPEKCENCSFAKRYSRQQPEEILEFCGTCRVWLCASCRETMGCNAAGHPITGIKPRADVSGIPVNDITHREPTEDERNEVVIYHQHDDTIGKPCGMGPAAIRAVAFMGRGR